MTCSRQQFEARYPIPTGVEWSEVEGRYRPIGGKVTPGFSVARHDTYVAFWIVWKASREDVVVKLPDSFTYHDGSEITRAVIDADKLIESLESAGLRASP